MRLLVSDVASDTIEHARFHDLPRWLRPGDLLVVNTSATLNAALPATNGAGDLFELHLSTQLPGGFWTVEMRQPGPKASLPFANGRAGTTYRLPAGGRATLLAPYPLGDSLESPSRLWIAAVTVPTPLLDYLAAYGVPIRYGYVKRSWPLSMYQTVFATEPGSAEMPSAGRPFTAELVTRLVAGGVQIAPLVLHTGVGSLESHEPPYEEYYRVPRVDRRTRQRRQTGRPPRRRRRDDGGAALWKRSPTKTATHIPGTAGHGSSSRPIDRSDRSAASSRGCTSHAPRIWPCSRASATGRISNACMPRLGVPAICGTSSATRTFSLGASAGRSHNDV